MKIWLIAILFVLGCASRKEEKAFEKSLDKPEANDPKIQVEADAKILEKFEVVAAPPIKKVNSKKATAKTPPLTVTKKEASKSVEEKNKVVKDYPPEMVKLNEEAKKVWSVYKPNHRVNEKILLDIHYLGMTVGKIMATNRGKKMINGKEVWHFHSRFKSAPFYSSIYELDDTVDTYVTTDEFLSIRYSLIQRESKVAVDDLQLYDRDQLKTFWFYKRKKTEGSVKNKEKTHFMPYFSVDPFSILFFYQGLPLKNGDIYQIPIVNKAKVLILRSEVEGREKIETELGDKRAIRVHATTKYTGETLKSGDLYFWFSDDEKRTLLKASASISLGSVTGDIVSFE